jgi:hypothetical protein
MPDAFTYEVIRGNTEHYLFVLYQGYLRIWDLNTFSLVSAGSAGTYLQPAVGVTDRDNFRIQSVGDYHFIINKSVLPTMDTGSSSPNPNPSAMIFVQAGEYLATYTVSVEYAGTVYSFTYQTPDNSVETNYQYIATNQIAATFFRAMTGLTANTGNGTTAIVGPASVAGPAGSTGAGYSTTFTPTVVGGNYYGDLNPGSGNVYAPSTLISLGFKIAIDGNIILIQRASDQNPFTVDASDGAGDQSISVVQNSVTSLEYLPQGGFDGFTVEVMGVGGTTASAPYYLTYNSNAGNGGAWIESVASGVLTRPLASTMPVAIFCSAPDTFSVVTPTWLPRISGDGTTSAYNPGFIGAYLEDIVFFDGRLGLVTADTYDLTQAGNPYNWWPQTAQTVLDDMPISGQIAASNTTATIQRAAVIDEQLTLWAQRAQFRLNSGVEPFTAQNIQDPQSTSYEFNPNCGFIRLGTKLYFMYDADGYSRVFILQYDQGRAVGDTDITAHVPEYIPSGVYGVAASTPIKMLFLRTDGASNSLFLYNWLDEGSTVVQSAWNEWTLPDGQILWHGVYQQYLYVLLQRADGAYILTIPLNPAHTDPGGAYQTRLDYRLTESSVGVSSSYNSPANTTTITFPYSLSTPLQAMVRVVNRATNVKIRGRVWPVVSTTATSVTVQGNCTTEQFYVGLAIASTRQESDFYIRTATGHIPTERLTVKNYVMDYRNTIYSRITVVNSQTGEVVDEELGIPGTAELGVAPVLNKGSLRAIVDGEALDVTITLINDSPFPSEWTAVNIEFESVERATPMLTPYGGPVQ